MTISERISVTELVATIIKSSVFEDRLEYAICDFVSAYGITNEQAADLQRELHRIAGRVDYTPF